MKSIYLIGSLRNPETPKVAKILREESIDVFDNWYSAGETADDAWRDYERARGHSYQEALDNHSAQHVYNFDKFHLNRCHAAVLTLPAGRSGHLEAGFMSGKGKPVFMLLDTEGEPERLDVMSQFLYRVCHDMEELKREISTYPWPKLPKESITITVLDAMWLSGLLEGEGSFCISDNVPRLVLQMTDKDIVERAAMLMGSKVWKHPPTSSGKEVWACGRAGLSAIEWMRVLRPYLGYRRQEQIVRTVQEWLNRKSYRKQDRKWWENVFLLRTGSLESPRGMPPVSIS